MRVAAMDSLRGLAALWVFSYHLPIPDTWWIRPLFQAGYLGVPLFFVISGYCITAAACSASRHPRPVRSFLVRRLWRIYPPLWASMVVVALVPFAIEGLSWVKTGVFSAPSPQEFGFLTFSVGDWLSVGSLTRAFMDSPGATHLQLKFTAINAVYWSLAIEVQFYLIVAAALACRSRFYHALLAVTVVAVAIPVSPVHGIALPYWLMFAFGVAVYWLLERVEISPDLVWLGAVLPLAAVILLLAGITFSPQVFALACAVWLLTLAPLQRAPLPILGTLGVMSYSIYLLHGRVQYLSMQIARQVFAPESVPFYATTVLITLAICTVFYIAFERPFTTPARSVSAFRVARTLHGLP